MNEALNRVAKALIDEDPTMFGYHKTHIAAKMIEARAVLLAIRNPTPEMIIAGGKFFPADMNPDWYVNEIFQAMIDEALK